MVNDDLMTYLVLSNLIIINDMDSRVVNLRHGPADHSYVGGGNMIVDDVQVESE